MKRALTIAALILTVVVPAALAQTASAPNAADIGKDQAQQLLKEVSVSKFEDSSMWTASMPLDMGSVVLRRMEGGPQGKTPIADEQQVGIVEQDKYVLGARVDFFRRGPSYVTIMSVNPLPIEGITKTISVWVVGRNYNHTLKIIVQDFNGQQDELTLGTLNFVGWKQLQVAIPPSIPQSEYHYSTLAGLKVLGFKIEFDPLEDYGSYYIYLDDMRAITDLFAQAKRDVDDMVDGW